MVPVEVIDWRGWVALSIAAVLLAVAVVHYATRGRKPRKPVPPCAKTGGCLQINATNRPPQLFIRGGEIPKRELYVKLRGQEEITPEMFREVEESMGLDPDRSIGEPLYWSSAKILKKEESND